jgi:short-subunit dehydrogenase
VISDINIVRLEQFKKELEPLGIKIIAVKCDVSNQADINNLAKIAISEMNVIHFLFSNAGIYMGGPYEYFPLEKWEKIMNVNIWGMILVVKAFIGQMLKQKFGHIIVTSSIAGSIGSGGVIAYSTTKFANSGFCEALYGEYKNKGINVSILCPFPLNTNLIENFEFSFSPDLLNKYSPEATKKGIEAIKNYYWKEFTKKGSGFLGGLELDKATKRFLKKVSKKKLYIFDRRYGRLFQLIRGLWPKLYKYILNLSGTRHNKLYEQSFQEFIKAASQTKETNKI